MTNGSHTQWPLSLRPRQYDTIAIVHRSAATLSPVARLVIELATRRIHELSEAVMPV